MSNAEKTAVLLLKRGQPLPVDLQSRLIATGVSVKALEDKHGE